MHSFDMYVQLMPSFWYIAVFLLLLSAVGIFYLYFYEKIHEIIWIVQETIINCEKKEETASE